MEQETVTRAGFLALASPLVVGLVQLVKQMLPVQAHKYLPLVALLFGQLAAFAAVTAFPVPPQPWPVTVLVGLGIGFGAVGLFAGVRSLNGPPKVI